MSVARIRRWPPVIVFLCALIPMPAAGQATPSQMVRGRVLAVGDTTGLEGVELTLVDSLGAPVSRSSSGRTGRFILRAPEPGQFELRASRLGYGTVHEPLTIGEQEMVEVELRMDVEAIRLDPLKVTARREIRQGTLDEFYDRMARMKEKGRGQFLTLDQIDNFGGMDTALLLQIVPGVWVTSGGLGNGYSVHLRSMEKPCTPDFYLDGIPMGRYRNIYPGDLEGVEVYRGPFEPVDDYWISRCGVVFLWRKKGWGRPFKLKVAIAAAMAGAAWFLIPAIF